MGCDVGIRVSILPSPACESKQQQLIQRTTPTRSSAGHLRKQLSVPYQQHELQQRGHYSRPAWHAGSIRCVSQRQVLLGKHHATIKKKKMHCPLTLENSVDIYYGQRYPDMGVRRHPRFHAHPQEDHRLVRRNTLCGSLDSSSQRRQHNLKVTARSADNFQATKTRH